MSLTITDHDVIGYYRVVEAKDEVGFHAIVAIHNINLGPAMGGCRVWSYDSYEDHLQDALRLAEGMTYKNALAGLKFGGGKATINAPKATAEVLDKFAEVMEYINKDGLEYITAGDVSTGPAEVAHLRERTEFVNGAQLGQDSGYATAFGVYMALMGALKFRNRELRKQAIFVEGLGKVGMRLTGFLKNEARGLFVSDLSESAEQLAFIQHKAVPVRDWKEGFLQAGVYSPCALGGTLDENVLTLLEPGDIVCGGANNQFSKEGIDVSYAARGITVVPDFLANAGGVIIVANGGDGAEWDDPNIMELLRQLQFTSEEVLFRARDEGYTPLFIAKRMAEEIFNA